MNDNHDDYEEELEQDEFEIENDGEIEQPVDSQVNLSIEDINMKPEENPFSGLGSKRQQNSYNPKLPQASRPGNESVPPNPQEDLQANNPANQNLKDNPTKEKLKSAKKPNNSKADSGTGQPQNQQNPALSQNQMKGFGQNRQAAEPNVRPENPIKKEKGGLFNGKVRPPKLGLSESTQKNPSTGNRISNLLFNKNAKVGLFSWFAALPLQTKVIIAVGMLGIFLIIAIIVISFGAIPGASIGNREMKDSFIQGDYTDDELCTYLQKQNYITLEDDQDLMKICQESPAYQFFTNFKSLKEEYEKTYERNRFQVNVELLYETLAYNRSDEEMYPKVTKEEIRKLIDASLEKIEETCVVKEYKKESNTCVKKKYTYTLYEMSLNKYVSYLKYGTTSEHPNYQNKVVERVCGEGKNTDYVFGFGLVNTSTSPLIEGSSDCPSDATGYDEKVTKEDYETLPTTKTTLEKLGSYGGVPNYDTRYQEKVNIGSNGTPSIQTSKNVIISPSHQTGNMYYGGAISEKQSMFQLASYLKNELESRGYNVFVVPENDGTNKYSEKHTASGVDWLNGSTGVYIALHSNATGSSNLGWGPIALYDAAHSESRSLASAVCNHIQKLYSNEGRKNNQTCLTDNGNRSEVPKFYKLGGKGGSILVEVGFHDNPDEARWILNNYSKIASSLADGIDQYVG